MELLAGPKGVRMNRETMLNLIKVAGWFVVIGVAAHWLSG